MGLFSSISTKLVGTRSQRELKAIQPLVDQIEGLGAQYHAMTDAQLRSQTDILKGRLAAGETLDAILPDAFAAMREAADRVLGKTARVVEAIDNTVPTGAVYIDGKTWSARSRSGAAVGVLCSAQMHLLRLLPQGVQRPALDDPDIHRRQPHALGYLLGIQSLEIPQHQHGAAALVQRQQ